MSMMKLGDIQKVESWEKMSWWRWWRLLPGTTDHTIYFNFFMFIFFQSIFFFYISKTFFFHHGKNRKRSWWWFSGSKEKKKSYVSHDYFFFIHTCVYMYIYNFVSLIWRKDISMCVNLNAESIAMRREEKSNIRFMEKWRKQEKKI